MIQLCVISREYKDLTNKHILNGLKVDKKSQLFPRLDINVKVPKVAALMMWKDSVQGNLLEEKEKCRKNDNYSLDFLVTVFRLI